MEGLGIRDDLKVLYLHNNYLVSFKYLLSQPALESFSIANNCIASFFALEYQPKLQHLIAEGNPICKHPHYRVMALMTAGLHLKKIDNEGTIDSDHFTFLAVMFKEREVVRKLVSQSPLVCTSVVY